MPHLNNGIKIASPAYDDNIVMVNTPRQPWILEDDGDGGGGTRIRYRQGLVVWYWVT
jgi:hypothetical protein